MKSIRKDISCPDKPAETSQKFAKNHLKKLYLYMIPWAQANCHSCVRTVLVKALPFNEEGHHPN